MDAPLVSAHQPTKRWNWISIEFGLSRAGDRRYAKISVAEMRKQAVREPRDYFASVEPPSSTLPPLLTHLLK
jgi:hypothetical protein